MVSPTRCTWIWVNSGSWWRTGRPSVLKSMRSQRFRHNWGTELNWLNPKPLDVADVLSEASEYFYFGPFQNLWLHLMKMWIRSTLLMVLKSFDIHTPFYFTFHISLIWSTLFSLKISILSLIHFKFALSHASGMDLSQKVMSHRSQYHEG